jgi:CubicO group peptidase (beta-lactamase class C family)
MFKQNKMKKRAVFTYIILALILCVNQLHSQNKSSQKIDELVQKYSELAQINGAVLVAENGNVIYSKGVGFADIENKIPNNVDTKFRLASITKQFTAALILQLVEKGKISLDGKLSDYLPYYRKDIGDKITIHQILSHTAGIANYTDDPKFMQGEDVNKKVEPKDFILKYCSNDLVFEPGTSWAYSNSGYFILGGVIEEVTGKKYGDVLQENILVPLGMTSSGYESSDEVYENKAKGYENSFAGVVPARKIEMTIPFSAGSMYSTVNDMFKWDQALYTDKILSDESRKKMFTPVLSNYGYGFRIVEPELGEKKIKIITHSGGIFGFNTMISRFVEDKHTIIVLNNYYEASSSSLTNGIAQILYGYDAQPPREDLANVLVKAITEKGIDEAIKEVKVLKEDTEKFKANEANINALGYMYLQKGKLKEAVEVLKLNVELFPGSFNVYDSYGEALAASGDKENAIANYKKSLELNPNNEGGKEMLKKLEGK